MAAEIEALTYESLRRIERAETRSSKLTKLAPDFWARLGEHLAALRARFAKEQDRDPSSREATFLADEIRSTQRLAEGIGEMRERKVAQAALLAMRTGKSAERPTHALPEEGLLFDDLVRVLQGWRGRVGKSDAPPADPKGRAGRPTAGGATPPATSANAAAEPPLDLALVRALDDIPSFVAPDDEQRYAFQRGEVGTLPRKAAELLAKRRKVAVVPVS